MLFSDVLCIIMQAIMGLKDLIGDFAEALRNHAGEVVITPKVGSTPVSRAFDGLVDASIGRGEADGWGFRRGVGGARDSVFFRRTEPEDYENAVKKAQHNLYRQVAEDLGVGVDEVEIERVGGDYIGRRK